MRWEKSVLVDAPAEVVWRHTIDVESWPTFTGTMQAVERLDPGPLRVGSTARIKQPGQAAAVWTVTRLEPGREFAWATKRLGVTMTGSHLVEEVGATCRNTLRLDVSGRGSRLLGALLGRLFAKTLATENAGFKSHSERAVAGR